jgi:hypothetical protein
MLIVEFKILIPTCLAYDISGRYTNVARTGTATQIDDHSSGNMATNAIDGIDTATKYELLRSY